MKRPSFQFYPADWRSNAKLRRCSAAERGDWIDLICLLHDSEEYGVLRWPLKDIAEAGCKIAALQALRRKGVLKGADTGEHFAGHTYTPRHAGKAGRPVVLLEPQEGPIWFSSRMVEDEYVRTKRATNGAAESTPKPPKGTPKGGHPSRDARAQSSSSTSTSSKSRKDDVGLPPDPHPPRTNGHDQLQTRELRALAIQALNFLNEKTGHSYESVPANVDPIVARLKQGSTLEDIRAVIAMKCREWSADEKMAPYLRPKTLFAAANFASYKGQLGRLD